MFDSPEIDAVYVATPHTLHAEHSRAALAAGKAVLCEKPMTVTPDECRDLQEYARARQLYLAEGMWTWFLPAIKTVQAWIAAGRIGRVRHVKADFGYPLPYDPACREYNAQLAGGCLLEMGIYPVAIATLFLRKEPVRLDVLNHLAPNGVEDDITILGGYDDRTAALATSFRCKLRNWAYVIGDEGYIAIPDFWRARSCHLYKLDDEIDAYHDDSRGLGFEFEIEAISDDILQGRLESATVRAEDSLSFQRQMAHIRSLFTR